MTKTVSIATSFVHKVRTLVRTVLFSDLYVLTNDEHWTMTPETHKYSAAAGSFLLFDYQKWRSTGHMQFDHYAVCLVDLLNNLVDFS